MAKGVDRLLRDKTRPPGIAPLATSLVEKVIALTLEPPGPRGNALDGARHGERVAQARAEDNDAEGLLEVVPTDAR
jgi:hypothetical protein